MDDVIRAVVELGGTYPDVVQALQEAKNSGALAVAVRGRCPARGGPGVRPSRRRRDGQGEQDDGKTTTQGSAERVVKATPASPSPELFYQKTSGVRQ